MIRFWSGCHARDWLVYNEVETASEDRNAIATLDEKFPNYLADNIMHISTSSSPKILAFLAIDA